MGAYRALAAKCPTDGFRESLARFRADRPHQLQRLSGESEPVLGQGGACKGSPLPVIEAGLPTVGPPGTARQEDRDVQHHTEALQPMAGALWTGYDAPFPAQMGGGDEKAL